MTDHQMSSIVAFFLGSCRLISPGVRAWRNNPELFVYANSSALFYTHYLEESAQKFRGLLDPHKLARLAELRQNIVDENQVHSPPFNSLDVDKAVANLVELQSLIQSGNYSCGKRIVIFCEVSTNRRIEALRDGVHSHWCHLTNKQKYSIDNGYVYNESFSDRMDFLQRLESFETTVYTSLESIGAANSLSDLTFIYHPNINYDPSELSGTWDGTRTKIWLDLLNACHEAGLISSSNTPKRYCFNMPYLINKYGSDTVLEDNNHFTENGVRIISEAIAEFLKLSAQSVDPATTADEASQTLGLVKHEMFINSDPSCLFNELAVNSDCMLSSNVSKNKRLRNLLALANARLEQYSRKDLHYDKASKRSNLLSQRIKIIEGRLYFAQQKASKLKTTLEIVRSRLRILPDKAANDLAKSDKTSFSYANFATPEEANLIDRTRCAGTSYLTNGRMAKLLYHIRRIKRSDTPGIFIEAGCAMGGSASLIASYMDHGRILFLYDKFEQIPPPSENDTLECHARYAIINSGKAHGIRGGKYYGYEENLFEIAKENILSTLSEETSNNIKFIIGDIMETMRPIEPIAFAHIDVDWYDTTMACLSRVAPQLSVGGTIIVDDYADWGGCQKAVIDFLSTCEGDYCFDDFEGSFSITRLA